MIYDSEFQKFAVKHCGVSSMNVDQYQKRQNSLLVPKAGFINPTVIEERQLNVAAMDVFSRLMMDRIIFLGDAIDAELANILQAQLLFLDSSESDKDISLYINSPGGVVYDGLAIYDTMQYIDSDISTICTGMAASMASILLAAGEKGKRYALPHSRVMIHQPMGGAHGQASDMEIAVNEIKKLKTELYDILVDHTGKSFEEIERNADRDHWLTSQEALEYGIIDEVVKKDKD